MLSVKNMYLDLVSPLTQPPLRCFEFVFSHKHSCSHFYNLSVSVPLTAQSHGGEKEDSQSRSCCFGRGESAQADR